MSEKVKVTPTVTGATVTYNGETNEYESLAQAKRDARSIAKENETEMIVSDSFNNSQRRRLLVAVKKNRKELESLAALATKFAPDLEKEIRAL